jgi:L-iditol 2-dehydrogenase
VQKATGGRGAHYVIEAVGVAASFRQMVDFARPAAKLAVVGIAAGDDFGFANSTARRKGLTLLMVRRSRHTLARAITLTARGHWRPEALITHRLGLGQVGHALELLADYADGVVKVIIDPRRS